MKTKQALIPSKFGEMSTATEVMKGVDLKGKTVVVTGGHSGIGLETTRVLTEAGAFVVVGARDMEKAHTALANFKKMSISQLDLADPKSIDRFAESFLQVHGTLHLLINNAGIMATPFKKDSRGIEMQFATNHLGHFQLTSLLWGALGNAKGARVINVSSRGHRFSDVDFEDINFNNRPYDKWVAYGQSKTANSLFTVELDKRGESIGVRSFAVHPGRIPSTDLLRDLDDEEMRAAGVVRENGGIKIGQGMKNIEQGAATTVWCATSSMLDGKGGVYCADCNISEIMEPKSGNPAGVIPWAIDEGSAKRLWKMSEEMVKLG